MKRFRNLNSIGKEILYAASGFGANLMMIIMGAYFTDAVNPAALLGSNASAIYQTINGACLIIPAVFAVLGIIGKVFDGLIDIPFASITDNLKTKWGRRRLPIAICIVPMIVSFILCWIPLYANIAISIIIDNIAITIINSTNVKPLLLFLLFIFIFFAFLSIF